MKNFEKYEKQMKEWGGEISLSENGEVRRCCFQTCCSTCRFCNHKYGETCKDKRVDWLYEDYKESLLTNEEREYLKAVIKPFRNRVRWVECNGYTLKINCGEHVNIEIPVLYNLLQFQKFNAYRQYSLEELGL